MNWLTAYGMELKTCCRQSIQSREKETLCPRAALHGASLLYGIVPSTAAFFTRVVLWPKNDALRKRRRCAASKAGGASPAIWRNEPPRPHNEKSPPRRRRIRARRGEKLDDSGIIKLFSWKTSRADRVPWKERSGYFKPCDRVCFDHLFEQIKNMSDQT
ncbi:hypothetical protein [uncultured Pyramidobacter sp.]|uniref:hypothetical protein n=1 Tax=uncultured Pyramidobacter sp. TaxID=1623495 RepID=UPI0028043E86|nr:hypothetical protein [uncultured Pyramidobacter sp.]